MTETAAKPGTAEALALAEVLKGGQVIIQRANGDLDVLRSDQIEMLVAALSTTGKPKP